VCAHLQATAQKKEAMCSVCQLKCVSSSVLKCVAVCCSVLQCVAVCCSVLHCVEAKETMCSVYYVFRVCPPHVHMCQFQCVSCSFVAVYCNVLPCSVLQCVAVCCSERNGLFRVYPLLIRMCQFQCVSCSVSIAVCCSVLQYVAVCCSVLQCIAVYCSVLPCVAVCCSERDSLFREYLPLIHMCYGVATISRLHKIIGLICKRALQKRRHSAKETCNLKGPTNRSHPIVPMCQSQCRCSVLQYVAVCCSVLQCVAVCCSVLQCVAACCSVLQCDAVKETVCSEYTPHTFTCVSSSVSVEVCQ